jgi:hypothetical protein
MISRLFHVSSATPARAASLTRTASPLALCRADR